MCNMKYRYSKKTKEAVYVRLKTNDEYFNCIEQPSYDKFQIDYENVSISDFFFLMKSNYS